MGGEGRSGMEQWKVENSPPIFSIELHGNWQFACTEEEQEHSLLEVSGLCRHSVPLERNGYSLFTI